MTSVRRSLAWSYAANAFAFVVTFGGSVIMARLLTPRELGVFAVATAVIGVLTILTAFGVFPIAVFRRIN